MTLKEASERFCICMERLTGYEENRLIMAHRNMAIFYAQTDHPDLSVDVIPIGLMKKTIAILLSFMMIFCLAACGRSAGEAESPSAENNSVESGTANDAESSTDDNAQAEDDVQTQTSGAQTETQGSKVLVAYFSATGTTKGVAEHIANGLNADIYEIIPEEPYTDADLNYNDNNSRSTIEMNDSSSRPAISGSVADMEQYDIVFIGFAGGIIGLNQEKPINQGFALV